MKTVVLANQKGGVGKTALATILAQYLARQGQKVLAIDFDHQGNLTSPIRRSKRASESGVTADQLLTVTGARVAAQDFVLVPAADPLMGLERAAAQHNAFASNLRSFLRSADANFDVCVIDTHPIPDIRVIAAMASADYLLAPIQLNQEALDGVSALLGHPRVGFHKIKTLLNPKLHLIGLVPMMVEATPFQKANFLTIVQKYSRLFIKLSDRPGHFACIPKRSAIPEAQAEGLLLWEMKKTAARDAWVEIEPTVRRIAAVIRGEEPLHEA